jgi:hypothetical protein
MICFAVSDREGGRGDMIPYPLQCRGHVLTLIKKQLGTMVRLSAKLRHTMTGTGVGEGVWWNQGLGKVRGRDTGNSPCDDQCAN